LKARRGAIILKAVTIEGQALDRDRLLADVDLICSSEFFRRSSNSISIFRYLIATALDGDPEQLKEYTIAREALGEDVTFDPQLNPRVRVEIRRLRERLLEFYNDGEGSRRARYRIRIPKGAYRPVIDMNPGPVESLRETDELREVRMHLASPELEIRVGMYVRSAAGEAAARCCIAEMWQNIGLRVGSSRSETTHQRPLVDLSGFELEGNLVLYCRREVGDELRRSEKTTVPADLDRAALSAAAVGEIICGLCEDENHE
jgi:hypothetical protein